MGVGLLSVFLGVDVEGESFPQQQLLWVDNPGLIGARFRTQLRRTEVTSADLLTFSEMYNNYLTLTNEFTFYFYKPN